MFALNSNVIKLIYFSFCLLTMTEVIEGEMPVQFYQDHLKVMTDLIEEFFDPCEDFFQHACGNYDQTVAPITPFMYNKEGAVRFFEENRDYFSTTGGTLLNGLYESCKQKNWDTSQWKNIDFLAEFSQWPFLHHQWEELKIITTWGNLTAQLATRGIPVFFDVFFTKNTIYMSPADIRCPAEKDDIKALIMSPATSVFNTQVADIISSELYNFCKDLSAELPTAAKNTSESENSELAKEFVDIFLELNELPTLDVLEARVVLHRLERLEEISKIVIETEPRVVINFVIWKMLEALSYDDCFKLTEEFEPLLLSEYWSWEVFDTKISKNVALASYLYHTTRFQKRRIDRMSIEDLESFLNKKHRHRRKDFSLERFIKNYGNKILSTEKIKSDYSGIEMKRDAFVLNYFNMKRKQRRLSFLQDNYVDIEDPNHPEYFLRKFLNFVILIGQQPLFHYFATEGFELWYDSKFLTSTDDLYTAIDCLVRQTNFYSDEYSIFDNLTTDQMENLLKFNRAFYETFYDYHFWLEGEMFSFTEDYVLEHFNLNSSRVLFYSVAQLHCGRNDEKYAMVINRSFMNSLEFRDAFECDVEVPMNPTDKFERGLDTIGGDHLLRRVDQTN